MTRLRVFCAKHPEVELKASTSIGTESIYFHIIPCPECLREAEVHGEAVMAMGGNQWKSGGEGTVRG